METETHTQTERDGERRHTRVVELAIVILQKYNVVMPIINLFLDTTISHTRLTKQFFRDWKPKMKKCSTRPTWCAKSKRGYCI